LGDLSNRGPAERRAEVTSAFFAVQGLGIAQATITFAAITIVIVLLSLALLLRVEKAQ
jgi:hypothetical protein